MKEIEKKKAIREEKWEPYSDKVIFNPRDYKKQYVKKRGQNKMANARMEFFSLELARSVAFRIVLPNDVQQDFVKDSPHFQRPMKTLYLLHGYSGCSSDWMYNSLMTDLAGKYNLAIILPEGENSFYLDEPATGRKFATYVGKELVDYTRKTFGLSDKRKDTLVGGFSMGGYGALHTGLAYPETFGGIAALSSALIVYELHTLKPGENNGVANYEYFNMVFGDLVESARTDNNPEVQIEKLLAGGKQIPAIYQTIGTEDFLYSCNQRLRAFLEKLDINYKYEEEPGIHDFVFWNKAIVKAVQWLLRDELR